MELKITEPDAELIYTKICEFHQNNKEWEEEIKKLEAQEKAAESQIGTSAPEPAPKEAPKRDVDSILKLVSAKLAEEPEEEHKEASQVQQAIADLIEKVAPIFSANETSALKKYDI